MVFYVLDPFGPKFSIREAASKLKVNRNLVDYWVKRYKETGSVDDAPRSGRPRETSEADDKVIAKAAENPGPGLVEKVQKKLAKRDCVVSTRTIQRRLGENGLKFGPVVAKPLLSAKHIDSRMKFARENLDRDWTNVVFSDEATFSTYTYHRKLWRLPSKKYVVRTVKHPAKVHIWGCFSNYGFGKIYCFTGILDAKQMVQIYKKALLPSAKMWFSENDQWILQEDNDPKHRSKLAQAWKSEQNVVQLPWPSMSPDLNPIENVWALLKARIKSKPNFTSNSLIRHIRNEWNSLSANYAENLARSCQRRLQAVIDANGDYTIY